MTETEYNPLSWIDVNSQTAIDNSQTAIDNNLENIIKKNSRGMIQMVRLHYSICLYAGEWKTKHYCVAATIGESIESFVLFIYG